MKVGDVMARDVEFIDGAVSLQEAAEMMGELDVGALPVGSADQLEGVVTDRDILYRYVAKGLAPGAVRVRDVMTSPVVSCDEDDALRAAMDSMAANHIRRMPVLGARGKVVGWITLADLSRKLLVDSQALQRFMQELTEAQP